MTAPIRDDKPLIARLRNEAREAKAHLQGVRLHPSLQVVVDGVLLLAGLCDEAAAALEARTAPPTAVPDRSVATVVTAALVLAQAALRRWTELYAHLQNECGEVVSRKLDHNLPPADHLMALEAIEIALPLSKVAPCDKASAVPDRDAIIEECALLCEGFQIHYSQLGYSENERTSWTLAREIRAMKTGGHRSDKAPTVTERKDG